MQTFFLRFPDEATAQSVLAEVGICIPALITPESYTPARYLQADIGRAFDPIGTITRGGVYDAATGEEIEPPTELPGWHANYAADSLPAELEPYNLDPAPKRPARLFA